MEDMDLSEDLEQILFLIEDNVFVRWRIDMNFFNQNIYARLFDRSNRFGFGEPRNCSLPAITSPPNTHKLLRSGFYQKVRAATSTSNQPCTSSMSPIRRRRPQSLLQLLQHRERGSWRTPTQCYVNNIFLPNSVCCTLATDDRMKYCSLFSPDGGRHLLVASVDGHITVYDTERGRSGYKEVARYHLDQNEYNLLDLDVSPDGREFLVSTWRNNVYTCNVLEEDDINANYMRQHQLVESNIKMGIFSVNFSNDGQEFVAAGTDGCIYVYDRTRNERVERIVQDAREDVNAVRYLDRTNNNVIIGAGNQGIIEIWDRRVFGARAKSRKPVATLFGHHDGVTYIDPKGDGRYFITNSKDQSVKLWDVRKTARKNLVTKARKVLAKPIWNYQNDHIPQEFYEDKKPLDGDCSVMTYRGHRVARTLIRAKFSPTETTGNRYIYTGCSTGRVIIYDTLTGKLVQDIDGHSDLVRDVSWHPQRPEIVSASFDEKINVNAYNEKIETKEVAPPLRRSSRIAAKRARTSSS